MAMLNDIRALPEQEREELIGRVRERAAMYRAYVAEELAKYGVKPKR